MPCYRVRVSWTRPAMNSPVNAQIEHLLLIVIIQLVLIIAAARLFGVIFRYLGQPQVCGEIAAGIILGPSLFGRFFPGRFLHVFQFVCGPVLQYSEPDRADPVDVPDRTAIRFQPFCAASCYSLRLQGKSGNARRRHCSMGCRGGNLCRSVCSRIPAA